MRGAHLTEKEKSLMLEGVFAAPIKSPYARYVRVFAFVRRPVMALSLIIVLGFGSVVYASEAALPGEKLYAVKTKVVEPILDKINSSPEKKFTWEEKKVVRRIEEAESLAKENKLDEVKTLELEKKIEQSSISFVVAAEAVASTTATSTKGRQEKVEKLKQDFRNKLEEKNENKSGEKDNEQKEREEKIKRLKDKAVKSLESKGNKKDRD